MGGGDLNMKKSWHPLLMKNQSRVYDEEKKALDERKRTAQLQKEREEERAIQELQRLQHEAGGPRREERVEWLYATPAVAGGPSADELEAYLLGKKRVDKLLKGNEELLKAGAATAAQPGGSFTSLQNANSARDTASKIREDPLLAIKKQEQAAYEKLLKNPARLKALRDARTPGGATPGPGATPRHLSEKDEHRREKEERRRRKEERRSAREERHAAGGSSSRHRDRSRSRSPAPRRRSRSPIDRERDYHRSSGSGRPTGTDDRRRSRSPPDYRTGGSRDEAPHLNGNRNGNSRDRRDDYHHQPRPRDDRRDGPSSYSNGNGDGHSNGQHRNGNGYRAAPPARPTPEQEAARKAEQAAKLAAMQSAASNLDAQRAARVAAAAEADRIAFEKEEQQRMDAGRSGNGPRFVRDQQKTVYAGGMDLAERIRRSGAVGLERNERH